MLPRDFVPHSESNALSAPATAPRLRVVASAGRSVTIELSDARSLFRGDKPADAVAATVLSYSGDAPPADPTHWRFECSTSRDTFNVQLDHTSAPGATVWLAAQWLSAGAEPGPICAAVAAYVRVDESVSALRRLAA
jgi:hypothetical protein